MSKPVSEAARTREALKYAAHLYGSIYEGASTTPATGDGAGPQLSTATSIDSGLSAFAQLGCHRLGVTRCLISVFDQKSQFIVAEATRTSTLSSSAKDIPGIWLGGNAIPRAEGICEHVLFNDLPCYADPISPSEENKQLSDLPVSVVPDLAEDVRFSNRAYIKNPPKNRFYAGVPLRSPRGINIGVYCVFADEPRAGLDAGQVMFLQEISRTVMGYLESRRSSDGYRRSARMVRGLGSFVEGKSTMSRWWLGPNTGSFEASGIEGALNQNQQLIDRTDERRESEADEVFHMRPPLAPLQPSSTAAIHQVVEAGTTIDSDGRADSGSSRSSSNLTATPTTALTASTAPITGFTLSSNASVASTTAKSLGADVHALEVKTAFSKAANVIRESIEVEGVVFLDASVGTFGGLVPSHGRDSSSSADASPNWSSEEGPSDKADALDYRVCRVLGFSTSETSSIDNGKTASPQISVREKFLKTLLRRHPKGKTFSFDESGAIQSGDSEEEAILVSSGGESNPGRPRPEKSSNDPVSRQNEGKTIGGIFAGARSVALVPLWDSHKERWFAGAFIWTKTPARIFTMEGELSYLRAFGMAIMSEVTRIETVQAEKAKSDLLGSISHELRSPLHGIVAAVELMQDTELDAFQGDVLHSLEACGRTLLDVIDHLLDYSKINRFVKANKEQARRSRHHRPATSERQQSFESKLTSLFADVEIDILTEESIESIYAGHNYQKMSIAQLVREEGRDNYDTNAIRRLDTIDAVESFGARHSRDGSMQFTFGAVSVYVDIDPKQSWFCHTQPGALRRIIMNLLGNSLKYTERGYVMISLKQEQMAGKNNRKRLNMKLTVTDSGRGMSEEYLRNRIFTPFAQEDPLNPGTGLGLSLVQQITKTLNGTIHVESQLGRGTSICVTLPLLPTQTNAKPDSILADNIGSLRGLRVSLRGLKETSETEGLSNRQPPTELELMKTLCRKSLHLEVVPPDSTDVHPDLIICTDLSLDRVAFDGTAGILPPVVVICRNAVAAHKLSVTHRKSSRIDVFEYISQPVGPRKLAKALVLSLTRWNDFKSSLPLSSESSDSLDENPFFSDTTADTSPSPSLPKSDRDFLLLNPPALDLSLQQPESQPYEKSGSPTGHLERLNITNRPMDEDGCATVCNQDSPRSTGSDARNGTKYLLVDDNRLNLQILSSFMKKLKRPNKCAGNGLEALEAYAAQPGHYRCVLMDISMPVMDGLEATRRIREFERSQRLPPATIIALTGLASASTQQEAFASGIDLFMTKPVRLKQLAKVLTERGLD